MGRIPQEEIDRIKREVRVDELARARGIALRQHGENLVGRCIWHDDHDPSLIITPSKNLWHCMGACNAGGDVFTWVQKAEGVSFRHAYELLSSQFFIGNGDDRTAAKRNDVPKLGSPFTLEMNDDELRTAYVDYCHEEFKRSPEASRYLEKRGLMSGELVTRFRLGFSNRTLGLRVPAMSRHDGQAIRTRLQNIGILRSSGHEHFNGCVVVPIFDEEGLVSEIYGRKITSRLTPGLAHHLFLPGPHRGVWNLDELRESKEIVLCEALIDAFTFWCAGLRNVTASYGVEGFTADHLGAFRRFGTERVLIAYDRDEAGDRAAAKLADRLIAEGIAVYRIEFPKGMDANEYARKVTPADKALGLLVRTAVLIGRPPEPPPEAAKEEAAPSPTEDPTPSLAASPVAPSSSELAMEVRGDEIFVTFGDRTYRIRGIKKNTSFDSLRINVLLTRASIGAVYLDTFDLAVARQRAMFERQAAVEIGVKEEVIHREIGQILCALERLRDQEIERAREPKQQTPELTQDERAAAMALLTAPDLLARISTDLTRCGLVGEATNKLVAYLAATSRKLDRPLAIIIQSSSAAGKTMLMDTVLGCMPPEEVVRYSAITGKALFYIPDPSALKHKILAISEEQGAEQATYALKLLQSEGKLSIASTGKDPHTGRLESQEYHVEGPIMPVMTTTAPEIDEELQNRCIVLTADEDREQTRKIHELQRAAQTIEGLLAAREADAIRTLHQNAQRLLRPILIANPYAERLTFLDAKTRTRRDHMKYLMLIRTIALLHQYQRARKNCVTASGERIEYIEVTLDDIRLANELAHEVLGRSLDELAPQTRKLLDRLVSMTAAQCARLKIEPSDYRFWQKDVRDFTGWPDYQVKLHMRKLVDMEYVLVHRGGRGQSFVYELLYRGEGEKTKHFLMGLADVETLRATNKRDSSALKWDNNQGERDTAGTAEEQAGNSGGAIVPIMREVSSDAASVDESTERPAELMFPKPVKKAKSYVLRRGSSGRGQPTFGR